MKKVICEICGSTDNFNIEITKKYHGSNNLNTCKNCGFVFVANRRSDREIAQSWSDEIFRGDFDDKNVKDKPVSYTSRIPAVTARLTYSLENLLKEVNCENKTICDVGGGEGDFLIMAQKKSLFKDIFSIEPSVRNSKILDSLGINHFNGIIENYDFKNRFDIVTLNWTVENTQSPRRFINLCNKLLNNDGYISVATGSRILTTYRKPLDYYIIKNNPLDIHSYHFSKNSLCNLLKVGGFEIHSINRYVDTDYLCVIGKKSKENKHFDLDIDDPKKVIEFFNRWDSETEWLKKIS